MTGMKDAINDALNMKPLPPIIKGDNEEDDIVIQPAEPIEIKDVKTSIPDTINTDLAYDYKTSRNILHTMVDVTNQSIAEAIQMVREVPVPRSFEVLSQLINTMRVVSKDLVDLQKIYTNVMKDNDDIEDDVDSDVKLQQNNITNNFNGTTEEILEQMMKKAVNDLKNDKKSE